VISLAGGIAGKEKIRMPLIRSVLGTFHMKTELYTMMKSIAPGRFSFLQVSSAYDRAWEWYCVSLERLKDLFAAQARTGNDNDVVIVGRPYTVLSADMNKGIPGYSPGSA
jgi:predicted nucleotide-binding protein (sugar kinase/HSP70/actin superfamily)